jgi:poly(A) polymerase
MLPTSVKIIKQLKKAGHEAYWAGGCVRDMLLGIEPKDFDIVTSATPDEIEDILDHTIPVGKQFGVILAVKNKHHFEVATFRSDSGYSDERRPDAVTFTTAKEDAKRRDFTINGMFYDPIKDKVIDYVGGQKDLDAKLIRFIGDPHKRILEDHLRVLRAIRFKNEYDFQYEPKTYNALSWHASIVVDRVSNERIAVELNKMLMSTPPSAAFNDMEDTGVLKIILPELQNLKGCAQPLKFHKEGDVWNHTMMAIDSLPETASLAVRWSTLLHDVGKPDTFKLKERIRFDKHVTKSSEIARKILNRFRFPKKMVNEIGWIIEHHMMMTPLTTMAEGRRRHWFLHPYFLNLMQLFKADIEGTIPQDFSLYDKIYDLYRKSLKEMPKEPKPLLKGEDVMKELGIKPGEKVGQILDKLREKQLAKELKTKKQALKWLKSQK